MSNNDFESIPILDMTQFESQHLQEREQFISDLKDACHHIGFFYLKNHGINTNLIQDMLKLTETFFGLTQDEKETVNISRSPHFRGYGKLKSEITNGIPDYKESYDLGLEQLARKKPLEKPYFILQGPNQWPASPILQALRWKEAMLQYIGLMQQIGEKLMQAIACCLGFPPTYFVKQFCANSLDSYALLRLLRYPPGQITDVGEPTIGVGTHIDAGCLVILLQDHIGGLQVQNARGQWVDAMPIKDTFVVNIGEALQIWSNNYFLATPHRVINTSSSIRHSIPFFFEPNLTTIVTPLNISEKLLAEILYKQEKNTKTRIEVR